MKNVTVTICLMVAVLFMAAGQGFGRIDFADGQTHNISSVIDATVYVDYQAPGMQTTVNLPNGGYIPSPYTLAGYTNGRINISGGTVYELYTNNSSQVTMSSGAVTNLHANDTSLVTMSGGTVSGYLDAGHYSHVTMFGGAVDYLLANNWSYVTMSGGTVGDLYAQSTSQVTMSGGAVGADLSVVGSSHVTVSGGTIGGQIKVIAQAILTIDGSSFAINGTPFTSGEIKSILGGTYNFEPYRTLTGTLANGNTINNQFRIGDDASIVLVPEPTTLLSLSLGLCLIRRFRR